MYEKGFAYLLQGEHEKVIYGVLKYLHVSRQDSDYEDLVIEGQIAFAQAYCMYCQTHDSVTEEAVMPYIYQKIKWRLLDLLRKQTRTKQRECGLPDTEAKFWAKEELKFDDFVVHELLEMLVSSCTEKDYKILSLILYTDLSVTEEAKLLAVSRKTVYKYKKSILFKFKALYD